MDSAPISVSIAFVAGVVSFLSPCMPPLVPIYLAQLVGRFLPLARGEKLVQEVRLTTFLHTVVFVCGFTLAFVALGATASILGQILQVYEFPLRQLGGTILVLIGLHLVGLLKLPGMWWQKRWAFRQAQPSLMASFLIGIIFALGWTPCVGLVLAPILGLAAAAATLKQGVLLLLSYALGMGLPFLLLSLGLGPFIRLLTRLRPHKLVLLLALRLCLYSVQTRQRPERLDARLPWLHLLLGLAFFVALTMSGHASAAPQNIVVYTLLANWLHLWASAFWIGGMLFLALVLLPTLSGTGLASQVPLLLLTLRTYSPWAIAGVLLMALTGPFAATVRLSGWEQLVTTAYGRVLGIKILLVGGLLLTSAWHVLLLRPRVRQAYQRYLGMSSPQEAEGPPLSELHETGCLLHQEAPVLAHHPKQPERHLRKETHRLLRVLRWEPLLGVGVLICVGFLTVFGGTVGARTSLPSPPITQSATEAFETTVKTTDGKFTILLTVTPAAVGANEFTVKVQDHRSSGQALGGQLLREGGVSLYLSYTGEMGAKTVNLQPDGKGRFGATEDILLAGKWSVRIQIRTVERTLHEAKISLQVSP